MCSLSPDENPFPRKEMIWAQWGLKDKLINDPDIWICQRCQDCSVNCPRDARPGEVMAALREKVIGEYAFPGFIAKAFSSPRYLPLILSIPAGLVVLYLWLVGDLHYPNNFHSEGKIILDEFIQSWWHADLGVALTLLFALGMLGLGIRRFWQGLMSSESGKSRSGLTMLQSLLAAILDIIRHANFKKCDSKSSRTVYWAHLGIFYGCLALLIATGRTAGLYWIDRWFDLSYHWESPWGILSPTKAFGVIGTALVSAGILTALYRRTSDPDAGKTSYGDWLLLVMICLAVLSGLATWLIRVAEWETGTYWAYLVHIVLFFELFIFAPFSKGAHIFYRLTAMTWSYYTGRGL